MKLHQAKRSGRCVSGRGNCKSKGPETREGRGQIVKDGWSRDGCGKRGEERQKMRPEREAGAGLRPPERLGERSGALRKGLREAAESF